MCSNINKRCLKTGKEIELNIIKKRIGSSLLDESLADIYFIVGEDSRKITLPANKYLLSLRSQIFKTIFYGNSVSPCVQSHSSSTLDHHNKILEQVEPAIKKNYYYNGREVLIRGVDPDDFKDFLTYLYTDKIQLTNRNMMAIFYLANEYKVDDLMKICSEHIKPRINSDNVIEFFQQVCDFKTDLKDTCWNIIEQYKQKLVKSHSFFDMRYSQLIHFIEREPSLFASEIEKFEVCMKWAKRQCYLHKLVADGTNIRRILKTILNKIDFKSMTIQEFTQHVLEYRLFNSEELINFWKHFFSVKTANQIPITKNEINFNKVFGQVDNFQHFFHNSNLPLAPHLSFKKEKSLVPFNRSNSAIFNLNLLPFHLTSTPNFDHSLSSNLNFNSFYTLLKSPSLLPLYNPGPLISIPDMPRCSNTIVSKFNQEIKNSCLVQNFHGYYQVDLFENVDTNFNTKKNLRLEKDIRKLNFNVDRSVFLRGIGVYGSRIKPFDFNIVTKIVDLNTDSILTCINKRLHCDGTPSIHFIRFDPYIMVHPNHDYDITVMVTSMKTYYGVGPRNLIIIPLYDNHKVTFNINSKQSTAGREQIACIYFAL